MRLLVDIGNQRIKWMTSVQLEQNPGAQANIVINNGLEDPKTLSAELRNGFMAVSEPTTILVSSVSSAAVRDLVNGICIDLWGKSPMFLESRESDIGVVNGYHNPSQLGVDRWMALIASRKLFPNQDVVVVDAGTAVTVDCLTHLGQFLGGVIFPGIRTMQKSLNLQTEKITIPPTADLVDNSELVMMNRDTRSAVLNGSELAVVAGVVLGIDRIASQLNRSIKVVISGGDAQSIAREVRQEVKKEVRVEPNLVLMGLAEFDAIKG